MQFKLDENLGRRTQEVFRELGHDAQTVYDEEISGCSDKLLFETCLAENRCLVTFDLDFADVVRFPPVQSSGISVIRVPLSPSWELLEKLGRRLLQALETEHIGGNLWILEAGRIRVHQRE